MHSLASTNRLPAELRAILGEEGYVFLAEAAGGTRLYVAHQFRDGNEVVKAIGREAANKLSRAMAPAHIVVPLARRERALYWRSKGLSNAQIARKLGITENGVAKLLAREADLPDRPRSARSPVQLDLF